MLLSDGRSHAQLTPWYCLVHRSSSRLLPPPSSCASDLTLGVLVYQGPTIDDSHTRCESCHVVPQVSLATGALPQYDIQYRNDI